MKQSCISRWTCTSTNTGAAILCASLSFKLTILEHKCQRDVIGSCRVVYRNRKISCLLHAAWAFLSTTAAINALVAYSNSHAILHCRYFLSFLLVSHSAWQHSVLYSLVKCVILYFIPRNNFISLRLPYQCLALSFIDTSAHKIIWFWFYSTMSHFAFVFMISVYFVFVKCASDVPPVVLSSLTKTLRPVPHVIWERTLASQLFIIFPFRTAFCYLPFVLLFTTGEAGR